MNSDSSRFNKHKRLYLSAKRKKRTNKNFFLSKKEDIPEENLAEENLAESEPLTSFSRNIDVVNTDNCDDADFEVEAELEEASTDLIVQGKRLFDVAHLFQQLKNIQHSNFGCTFANLQLKKEVRSGFYSEFHFTCNMCQTQEIISTEKSDDKEVFESNLAMVKATICTGNGFSQLEETSGLLNMPCLSVRSYLKHQEIVNNTIIDLAWEKMEDAGKEEARLAIQEGNVSDDGYPQITVVADGSWAKRSYRRNYNSLSGVACIVGYRTKKILFIGVRNSYCSICTRPKTKNIEIPEHHCFKNWSKTATAMEADIIVEGFKNSKVMHGLIYNRLIGDGDSSVISQIMKTMPYGQNIIVRKVECTNHILRNYINRLRDVTKKTVYQNESIPVIIRNKLKENLQRLRTSVKCAINYRCNQNTTLDVKVKDLVRDLKNGPSHVFGEHNKCQEIGYFCQEPKVSEETVINDFRVCGIWDDIQSALNLLVHHANSLIFNLNNNVAESFNAVVAKFINGKTVNYTSRGVYEARCHAAVLSFNEGKNYHESLHRALGNQSPGHHTKKYIKRKISEKVRQNLCKKFKRRKQVTLDADEHYGAVENEKPDMDPIEFKIKKDEFLKSLMKTEDERNQLQQETVSQSTSDIWKLERRKRLTASYFGTICKMRKTTSCESVLKSILYSTFYGSSATRYGLEKEPLAIRDFENLTNIKVEPAGLFIDEKLYYIAASPDGLISNDGLIEVKCPASAAKYTPQEAIQHNRIKFCTLVNGNLNLKRSHNYYFQIQGQLHITKRKYCFFILWTPRGLMYEKIYVDDNFWECKIQNKLEDFYFGCMLPELIDPRFTRNMSIRNPART